MEARPHVLIVDDEEDIRRVLHRILQPLDLDVCECGDGVEAMAQCGRRIPDVILLDMLMPRQGGVETCRQVRASEALKDIPIIVISSLGDTESKVEAFRAGAHDYITKPFDPEEVRARVLNHLELGRRGREIQAKQAQLTAALEEMRALNHQLLQVNERLLASEGQREGVFSTMRELHVTFALPLRDMLREAGELALGVLPGSRKAEAFHRMREAISTLEHHLSNLASAASLETGDVAVDERPLDAGSEFRELIRSFVDLHAPLGTGLEIGTLPEPGALVVPTDPGKARTILWNMLEYACHRTPPGESVGLDIRTWDMGMLLEVSAGGRPLTDVELTFLFDPTHPGDPMGMAISVARSLADLLGGSLTATPRSGGGVELRCFLPAATGLERLGSEGEDGLLAM